MKFGQQWKSLLTCVFVFLFLAGCAAPPTPNLIATDVARAQAVAATLTAGAPAPTFPQNVSSSSISSTTIPTSTPPPSPTLTNTPLPLPTSTHTPPPVTLYNLIMRYSKNCFGVLGNQAAEVTCNQTSQVWNLVSSTNDYFQLQFRNTGNCLSASSANVVDPFILKNCQASDDQLWQKRPSGGYFQLANKLLLAKEGVNMCPDARQWNQPIIQWPCKPWQEDDQLDNQLFCQSTTNTANCAPPAGVYVTNLQQTPPPYTDEGKPNNFHFFFQVTFSNTTGQPQPYRWFVKTFGQNGGQTAEQLMDIPTGTHTISVGPWNLGRTCADYTAKVIWKRADGLFFTFKDPNGNEYVLPFQVRTC